jgi:heat shock protein HslJ
MSITRRFVRVVLIGAVVGTVALPLSLMTAGCGSEDAAPDLDGTAWTLATWSVSSIDPADFTITASFADGRIGGTSAVNSYGGPYTTGPDDAFSTGEIASTLMAGPEPAMRAEEAYMELLQAAASYEVAGGTLTLFDEFGDAALVFESAPAP